MLGGGTADRKSSNYKFPFTFPHPEEDVAPWKWCCEDQPDELCELYVEKRPINGRYKMPKRAAVIGDPHLRTFDGVSYTFNGVGEFWLLTNRSVGTKSIVAQGRFERVGWGSEMTAVALQEPGSSLIQVITILSHYHKKWNNYYK